MVPMPGVTITRDPRAIVVGVLLLLSVFVVAFVWPVLGWHARASSSPDMASRSG
jgi:hypothetical protein